MTEGESADIKPQDAEFPGIVARPIGNFAGSKAEYHYQTLRCNVGHQKAIYHPSNLTLRSSAS